MPRSQQHSTAQRNMTTHEQALQTHRPSLAALQQDASVLSKLTECVVLVLLCCCMSCALGASCAVLGDALRRRGELAALPGVSAACGHRQHRVKVSSSNWPVSKESVSHSRTQPSFDFLDCGIVAQRSPGSAEADNVRWHPDSSAGGGNRASQVSDRMHKIRPGC